MKIKELVDRLCVEVERRVEADVETSETEQKLLDASAEATKWKRDAEIYQARVRVLEASNDRYSREAAAAGPARPPTVPVRPMATSSSTGASGPIRRGPPTRSAAGR